MKNHCEISVFDKTVKIQKVFRKYKLKKKYNYFKKLPIDLQHKIITYIMYDYNDERNKKIAKIILHKIDIFIKKYLNFQHQIKYLYGAIQFYNFLHNNFEIIEELYPRANYLINNVLYLFYLLDKYQSIIVNHKEIYSKSIYDVSSIFHTFLSLREHILKYKKQIINIENSKYIVCVFNFKQLYSESK